MKAEERHELKENDLGSWLQYGLPLFLRQNGSYILLLVALCFLGYQLWNMHERKQAAELQSAWAELESIDARPAILREPPTTDPSVKFDDNPARSLQDIADRYDNKDVKAKATLELGVFYLLSVVMDSYPANSKMMRSDALARAEETFKKALADFGDDLLVAGKAHLGLAAVAEDRGDWDEAKKQYEILTDKGGAFKDSPFVALGQAKLSGLNARRDVPDLAGLVTRASAAKQANPIQSFTVPGSGTSGSGIGSGMGPAMTLPGSWNPEIQTQLPFGPQPPSSLLNIPATSPAK